MWETVEALERETVERAVSAVVGVAVMLVIVVVVSSVIAGFVLSYDDSLNDPDIDSENVNPWGDDDALLAPEDATAGAVDVRYRVLIEIKDSDMNGDSLNELEVSVVTNDQMFQGTGPPDIEQFEVERTDGTVMDIESDVNGWDIRNGGSELEIQLTGSEYPNPSTGDVITVIFDGVDNPSSSGTYDLTVTLNQDEDEQDGELEIIESSETLGGYVSLARTGDALTVGRRE